MADVNLYDFLKTPVPHTKERNAGSTHQSLQPNITDPKHGQFGWVDGKPMRYNAEWAPYGWFTPRNHQILTVLKTGIIDHDVMPDAYYLATGEKRPLIST